MAENSTSIVSQIQVNFSWHDYLIFSGLLGVSALIGVYFGCFGTKQATASEYLMGGKKMGVFPIAMSLVASHISGLTLLAVPADVYKFGASYALATVSFILMTFFTCYVYMPVYYKLGITSTYEYLRMRFDAKTRTFASFLFAMSQFLYLPLVIYIPALAFSTSTGLNIHVVTPIICGVCIFYTTIGGLKAVVWTDTLQFTVTLCSITATLILGVKSAGGLGNVFEKAASGQRLNIFDFDPDVTKRDAVWAIFIGYTIHWISGTNTNQSSVQKFLSIPNLRKARLAAIYYAIGIIIVKNASVFSGLLIYAAYADCDPFVTGRVERRDQLLPFYVLNLAKFLPGFAGLFIAGVFSTALSTLSAHLNCLAGTIYEDFLSDFMPETTSEIKKSNILKFIVALSGLICTALVFLFENLGGLLPLSITFSGITAGPLLGMFTLGILFPRANSKGAFYGGFIGLAGIILVTIMKEYYKSLGYMKFPSKPISTESCDFSFNSTITQPFHNTTVVDEWQPFFLFRISFYYYTCLAFLFTLIAGLVISYSTEDNDRPVDKKLLSPVIYPWLKRDNESSKSVKYLSVEEALNKISLVLNKDETN